MNSQSLTTIDIAFIRTDGIGRAGERVERFGPIASENLSKYGADALQIGWGLLAERFYQDAATVKEMFVIKSINFENE